MELFSKEFWGLVSLVIGIGVQFPYLYYIWHKKVRPHAITFFVWSLTMGGVAWAQFSAGAGSGAWVTVAGFFFMTVILFLALLHHGERNIKAFDWFCLALALVGFMAWLVTKNALWAVLFLTLADVIAYGPTYRKSWINPLEESPLFWIVGTTCFVFAVPALENYTFTTLFYPIMATILNVGLALMIWYRRFQLKI